MSREHFTVELGLLGRVVHISDEYRAKATEILLQIHRASDDETRTQLLNIAVAYARLAEHAERAGNPDIQSPAP